MNQSMENWWPKWRIFDALADPARNFDRYGHPKILLTFKADTKMFNFIAFFGNFGRMIAPLPIKKMT